MGKSGSDDLVARGTEAVYAKTSRRGFLTRASGFLAAVGLGELGLATAAEAAPAAPKCCTGTSCKSLGLECQCRPTKACPPDWEYTGYTWACCGPENQLFLCRDCVKRDQLCVCGCHTRHDCGSTMTELATSGVA